MRSFNEILVNDSMCFLFPPLEDELSHLLQMSLCLRAIVVVGGTAPKGFFI